MIKTAVWKKVLILFTVLFPCFSFGGGVEISASDFIEIEYEGRKCLFLNIEALVPEDAEVSFVFIEADISIQGSPDPSFGRFLFELLHVSQNDGFEVIQTIGSYWSDDGGPLVLDLTKAVEVANGVLKIKVIMGDFLPGSYSDAISISIDKARSNVGMSLQFEFTQRSGPFPSQSHS